MADTRINALSTASVSETTDYLPIDGSTGTRKLSAFSPSFGGNATVGGTLTVNGTGNSTFAGSVIVRRDQAAITALTVDNQNTGGTTNLFLTEDAGSANYFRIYRSGSTTATPNVVNISNVAGGVASTTAIEFGNPVKVNATTASTTTSSGALVVGNGTSGGLGVGGAINAGSSISSWTGTFVARAASANPSFYAWTENTVADRGVLGFEAASSTLKYRAGGYSMSTGTEVFSITNAGVVSVPSTTASTSTSSGALVVSGGVGVAKRIFSGEGLDTAGDNSTHISFVRNGTVSIGPDSAATPALVVSTAIKTSAPSGGTAANWKLGTVATVSPTSPNRTIEVEIGGTTYYLHAKTTNN